MSSTTTPESETYRPLPVPTPLSKPYWDGCAQGELRYIQCSSCGHVFFPAEDACIRCQSFDLEWKRSSGRGTVYTYSQLHREPSPSFPVPVVLAIIELDEGYTMFSNVVECNPDEVRIDMPVEVVFEDMGEGIHLPFFRPVQG